MIPDTDQECTRGNMNGMTSTDLGGAVVNKGGLDILRVLALLVCALPYTMIAWRAVTPLPVLGSFGHRRFLTGPTVDRVLQFADRRVQVFDGRVRSIQFRSRHVQLRAEEIHLLLRHHQGNCSIRSNCSHCG